MHRGPEYRSWMQREVSLGQFKESQSTLTEGGKQMLIHILDDFILAVHTLAVLSIPRDPFSAETSITALLVEWPVFVQILPDLVEFVQKTGYSACWLTQSAFSEQSAPPVWHSSTSAHSIWLPSERTKKVSPRFWPELQWILTTSTSSTAVSILKARITSAFGFISADQRMARFQPRLNLKLAGITCSSCKSC